MFVIVIIAGITLSLVALVALTAATVVMKREDRSPGLLHSRPRSLHVRLTRRLFGAHTVDSRRTTRPQATPTTYDLRSLVPAPRRGEAPVKGGERRW